MIRSATSSPRLLASGAVLALAVGLLAAPSAQAAGATKALTDPKAVPSPGFAATGVHTDACDHTTTPGWISTTTPELSVTAAAPTAWFAVFDESATTETKIFDAPTQTGSDGVARIKPTGLTDGHTYAWRAWPRFDHGVGGAPTSECRFRVDTTQPGLAVTSTDFPASGSGLTATKYAGQTGTFTITGTDQDSGVACYQYVLNSTPSVGWDCHSPNTVLAGADGSAALQIKPIDWGTNVLYVQAMDNAGNVSQPFGYSFYAPSNPNPPQAPGDVDNDGIPDIVLPDAAGNLQVISGGSGNTVPTTVVPAVAAPAGGTWANAEIAHRGWDNTAPADTVFYRNLSADRKGYLYAYRNQGSFNLGSSAASLVPRPTTCADVNEISVPCPAGYASDWAAADQIVALGAADTFVKNAPWLLTVEHGNLWLFGDGNLAFGSEDAQQLTTAGNWTGYDLIAPGADAKGNLALWARDRATGQLHAYPLPMKANGIADFSTLADPTSGVVASGLTPAAYPTLGSSGDLNGDGVPDLWAVTADRHLVTFSGYATPKDLGVLR